MSFRAGCLPTSQGELNQRNAEPSQEHPQFEHRGFRTASFQAFANLLATKDLFDVGLLTSRVLKSIAHLSDQPSAGLARAHNVVLGTSVLAAQALIGKSTKTSRPQAQKNNVEDLSLTLSPLEKV